MSYHPRLSCLGRRRSLRDISGRHPTDVGEERYITALVDMVVAGLADTADQTDISPPEPGPDSIVKKTKE